MKIVLGSGSVDPHFLADPDPDPKSQNNADPADPDPDPKHCIKLSYYHIIGPNFQFSHATMSSNTIRANSFSVYNTIIKSQE